MNSYEVNVTEIAEIDLIDIVTYISEQFMAEQTATEFALLAEKTLSSLAQFPERIPLLNDDRLRSLGYRKISIGNYLAFFSIDKKNKIVYVERILYNRRDWESLL